MRMVMNRVIWYLYIVHVFLLQKYLADTDEPKISITIYQILNNRPLVYGGWGEDVNCTNKAVNETKLILLLPSLLKLNKSSEFVPALFGK